MDEQHGPWENFQKGPWEKFQNQKVEFVPAPGFSGKQAVRALSGDPLSFIDDADERAYIYQATEQLPDRDEYRKRMALAAYFTAKNKGSDYRFVIGNLDDILKKYYNKKENVGIDWAYGDLGTMLNGKSDKPDGLPGDFILNNRASSAVVTGLGQVQQTIFNNLALAGKIFAGSIAAQAKADLLAQGSTAAANMISDPVVAGKKVENQIRNLYKDNYGKIVDEAASGMNLPENWVTNSDSIGNWIANFGISVLQYAPQLTAQTGLMALTGIPASLGLVFGVDAYYDIKDDHPEMTENQAVVYGVGIGLINTVLEKVTLGIIEGKVTKEVAKSGIKKGLIAAAKHFGWNSAKEGSEEAMEEIATNLLDISMGLRGDTKAWKKSDWAREIFRNAPESFLTAAPTGGLLSADFYHSMRELHGASEAVRSKHEARKAQLQAKENLTPIEEHQLKRSQEILETEDAQKVILFDAMSDLIDRAESDQEIRSSEEFRLECERNADHYLDQEGKVDQEALENAVMEQIRTRRQKQLEGVLQWSTDEVAEEVGKYAQHITDTVFHVVDNFDAMPQAVRDAAANKINRKPRAAWYKGEVYLDASRVRPHEVFETLTHEVVGHKGLRAVIPEAKLNGFLDSVFSEHNADPAFQKIIETYNLGQEETVVEEDGVKKTFYKVEDVAKQREAAEEYIAGIAKRGVPKPSWWKALLQRIRELLAKLPWSKSLAVSDSQIESVLARASKKMRKHWYNRGSEVVRDGAVRFDIEPFSLKNAVASKDGYRVERVNENAGHDLNNAEGVVCEKTNQIFDPKDVPEKGFAGWVMEKIKEWEKEHPLKGVYPVPALNADVNITTTSIRSIGNHGGPDAKYNLLPVVPEMLKNAVLVQTEVVKPQNKVLSKSHILAVKVRYGENQRYVAVMVIHESNGKFYYDHSLLVIEEGKLGKKTEADIESRNPATQAGPFSHSAHVLNIAQKALLSSGFDKKDENNVRFSVAPVIEVEKVEVSEEGNSVLRQMEEKRKTALADTLNAKDPYDVNFTDNWTVEEWSALTEEERKQQIEKEYDTAIDEFSADSKKESDRNYELDLQNAQEKALKNAAEQTAEFAKSLGFDVGKIKKNSSGNSFYLWVEDADSGNGFELRFSDHKQPANGSYLEEKYGSSREVSDFSTVISNGKIDLAGVWQFLQENTPKKSDEADNGGTFDGNNPDVRFSVADYSAEEERDIITLLKPFIGSSIQKTRAEIKAYLDSCGVDIPEQDAWEFAVFTKNIVMAELAKRGRERRDQWLYDNFPFYAEAVDFGGKDFKIVPSGKFHDTEYTGSWIAEAFRKPKPKPEKNESDENFKKRLAQWQRAREHAKGIYSDELAQAIARKINEDALDVEQNLMDFFRDLTKKEFWHEYKKFKEEQNYANREQNRMAKEEFLAQEKFRIEDEAVRIIEAGEPVSAEWCAENRKVYQELYRQLFQKEAPSGAVSQSDLDAINLALENHSADAASIKEARRLGREDAWQKYNEELNKVKQNLADTVKLQREAIAFAEKNLDPELRGKFLRRITALTEMSAAKREAEFQKILSDITAAQNEARKKTLLDRIAKRLNQLGERVDAGRKVRGLRDIETQQKLNRIIEISRMDAGSMERAVIDNQNKLNSAIESGESTVDFAYDLALLNQYGELWNKSAAELDAALADLEQLAKSGKDRLLDAIMERAAADQKDRNELWQAVNGMKRFSPVEKKKLEDRRARRWKILDNLDNSFWNTLSLDGIFEAMAFFENDENHVQILDRFRRMAHQARLDKDTINQRNADDVRKELLKLTGAKNGVGIAQVLGKWREVSEKSGVFRFDPDPEAKQFDYAKISVEEARRLLAQHDAGKSSVLADYEAEAIRAQLRTLDLRLKNDVPDEFKDGATARLLELIKQEQAGAEETQIVLPRPTFNGKQREVPLSQMQGLFLKLMWEQPSVRYKMHYNGWSEESFKQLDKFLLPEVKDLGNWMRKELEKDRSRIDEVYRALYFAAFPHEENYFPSLYDVSKVSLKTGSVDLAESGAGQQAVAYTPGALKVRTYHLKDVRIGDALTVFQNHRMLMNHFVTHAESARKMRAVLLNPDIRYAVENEHGKVCYKEMVAALTDFINGGNADVQINDLASRLYGQVVRAKMAFNAWSGVKQTLGFLSYLQEIPASALASGMAYAAAHPKEVFATLKNTDYFRSRWAGGGNSDLRMLLDAAGKNTDAYHKLLADADEIGSLPLRFGDAVSSLFGGFAVYKYHYDNLVKRGMTQAEARKEAILRWEMATERTQQSSAPFLLNRYQRGGYGLRLFTTFRSNQILMWNHYAPAVYKAMHYKKALPLKEAGRTVLALLLSSAAMTAWDKLRDLGSEDEYQWIDYFYNALGDMLCGAGPAGSLAEEAVRTIQNGRLSGNSLMLGDLVNLGYSVMRQLKDDTELSDKNYRDVVNVLVALGYVFPVAAPVGAVARETRKWWRIFDKEE